MKFNEYRFSDNLQFSLGAHLNGPYIGNQNVHIRQALTYCG
jgi:hypothetical protein